MKNNYGLPKDELNKIFERDSVCVYCQKIMTDHTANNPRRDWYSIEHLNYLPPWNNSRTVVICCWSCNSSRGNKKIKDWLNSDYCKVRKIKLSTVASAVKKYVTKFERK